MTSTPYEDHVYQLDTFDVSVFKNQLLDTVCSSRHWQGEDESNKGASKTATTGVSTRQQRL